MNDDVLITKVKQICNKKPKERSHSDLLELEDLTKNTKVFKNLIETNGDYAHRLCCQHLVYEYCAENNYLFKQGDPGTRFYIIISGNVGVEIPMKDEHSGEIKTIEVVSFTKGACFGELALESSKPRAASIKCKSDSHFVALEKVDYNRMIAKMVRDKRDFIVNFFSSLPIFSNMTKGSLAKLTYNFREKEYIKNQVVYKEGDFAVDAFIIVEGEFLFTKKIKVDDGRKKYALDTGKYDENSEILKIRAKGLQKKLVQIGNISKLGIGELFGIEEAENEPRKYSCSCNTIKGKVLVIPKSDLKKNKGEDILNYISQRNSAKEKEINERASM